MLIDNSSVTFEVSWDSNIGIGAEIRTKDSFGRPVRVLVTSVDLSRSPPLATGRIIEIIDKESSMKSKCELEVGMEFLHTPPRERQQLFVIDGFHYNRKNDEYDVTCTPKSNRDAIYHARYDVVLEAVKAYRKQKDELYEARKAINAMRSSVVIVDFNGAEELSGIGSYPHLRTCGTEYRGCDPNCPKELAEQAAGEWLTNY